MTNRSTKRISALLLCAVMVLSLGMSTVSAEGGTVTASYVECSWDGSAVVSETKTADCTAVPSSGNMTSGWYFLDGNVTKSGRVESITGDVHLILNDGYTLDVKGLYVPAGSTLSIYGQTAGTGKLYSHPTGTGAGIGGGKGNKAGGSVTIKGGVINARGGAGIGSGVDGESSTITITGGEVNASSTRSNGPGVGGSNCSIIHFGYTEDTCETVRITISKYDDDDIFYLDKPFKFENGKSINILGPIGHYWYESFDGKTLLADKVYIVTFAPGDEDATGEMEKATILGSQKYTLPECGFTAPEGKIFKEWSVVIGNAGAVTKAAGSKITVNANTTVTAVWEDIPVFGNAGFILPAGMASIEANAFEGVAATVVEIPANCTSIGDYAFKNCTGLTMIRIPANCALGTDVFDGCTKVYIFSAAGSPAEWYCNSHSNCVFIEESQD